MAVHVSSSSMAVAETISCYSVVLLALLLVLSCCEPSEETIQFGSGEGRLEIYGGNYKGVAAASITRKACDEIYVVREGDTLQTISEKCGDPFIVEENPHIHDPDDVFPGLVIKITPFKGR